MDYIEDDGDSIFVILADQTDVGIRAERFNSSETLMRDLAVLEIWEAIILCRSMDRKASCWS